MIGYKRGKGDKITFTNLSNRRDTSLRMSKIRTHMLKELHDRQNIEYEKVNKEAEMSDLINDYNRLAQNVSCKKVNKNKKILDAKTIKILAEINS